MRKILKCPECGYIVDGVDELYTNSELKPHNIADHLYWLEPTKRRLYEACVLIDEDDLMSYKIYTFKDDSRLKAYDFENTGEPGDETGYRLWDFENTLYYKFIASIVEDKTEETEK